MTGRPPAQVRVARWLTEALAPWVLAAVVPVVVGTAADADRLRGLGLGLVAALFSGVVPYLLIRRGVRRGRWEDPHVSRREDRPLLLAVLVVVVVLGLVVLALVDAPPALLRLSAAMVAGAGVGAVVSLRWKISLHTAVVAGSVAALVVVLGPWASGLSVLVVATGWARLVLRAHTPAQVVVGAVVGALVAGGVMSLG